MLVKFFRKVGEKHMQVSRRNFLKISGATATGIALSGLGFDVTPVRAYTKPLKIQYAKESITICPYCSCGCGAIVSVSNGKVINIEGDPDHPINRGTLCSKGSAISQISHNRHRLSKVQYRASGSDKWEEKSWDWAIDKIAKNIKKNRDKDFIEKNKKGNLVNRVETIANFGGAGLDNEECYALAKFARTLGIVNLEHQARI